MYNAYNHLKMQHIQAEPYCMAHRKSHVVYIVLFVVIAAILLPALFVYYVDPYQIYHRSRYPNMGLTPNQRYQNAGLIHSYLADPAQGYDSVMIGSSLSDNFTSADAQHYLGWKKTLRLFIDGGNPKELLIVSHHAASKKNVQYVLWEIRPRYYSMAVNDLALNPSVFPAYLYNNHMYDDFRYIFNKDVLAKAYGAFKGNIFPFDPDTIGYWGEDQAVIPQHKQFNSAENLLMLDQKAVEFRERQNSRPLTHASFPVIDDELVPAIDSFCNKDIEIVFYITPTTKTERQIIGAHSIYFPRYILEKITPCQNMSLHAFDLEDFSNDMNNYKDLEHYLPHISQHILELIGKKSNVLTPQNIEAYENNFKIAMSEYKVYSSYTEK